MEKANADICKDFHKLMKNVEKLSDGQAVVTKWKEEDLQWFVVEICPNGGLYHGGKFVFVVCPYDYPTDPPTVICLTRVYHPNIDSEYEFKHSVDNEIDEEYFQENELFTNVCVSLLAEDWEPHFTFEDCIQSLLFLFYEPNIDDPLSPLIDSSMDLSAFEINVKRSLLGLDVDSFEFKRNYILDDFDERVKAICDEVVFESKLVDGCDSVHENPSDMNSVNLEVKNISNSDPPNKEDEVIEKLTDSHEKFGDGIYCLASVDLVSEIDEKPAPVIMDSLPDVVQLSRLLEVPVKPVDAFCDNGIPLFSESQNLVDAEPPPMERPVSCDNIGAPPCLVIERDSKLGANVIIDCEENGPDLPTPRGPVQKCISATMWMVKFFFTQIIPELYKS
ncbi:uncharacterized protein LOC135493315 [Lineus longissimus]|uniref:uncharacterized protein LOC135493315 n=1 Tax=Lineus longissimus TaxID=88925 RepID=UPI002B4FAB17